MTAQRCPNTGNWFVTGYLTRRRYWGATPRAAEQNAQLYFHR